MKRHFCLILAIAPLCGLLLSGCGSSQADSAAAEQHNAPTAASIVAPIATSVPETTAAPTETTKPSAPERPFSDQYPYLAEVPAETNVFKSADSDSDFVQTIGDNGTFTITEEVRAANGDVWGRLKSGIGWINLSDPLCDGADLPPVTVSRASNPVLESDHHSAVVHTSYAQKISFVAHETVTNLRIVFTNAGEIVETVYTQSQLEPGKPLVAHLSFAGDFYGYNFHYTDASGIERTVQIHESLLDGRLSVSY